MLSTARFNEAGVRIRAVGETTAAVDGLVRGAFEMEAGLRAYLLTGEPAVLRRYRTGEQLVDRRTRTLATLLRPRRGEQLRAVASLHRLGHEYRQAYVEPLIARRARGPLPHAAAVRAVHVGRRRIRTLVRLAEALRRGILAGDNAAVERARATAEVERAAGIGTLVAALGIIGLLIVQLRRGVFVPLRRLARASEDWRAGASPGGVVDVPMTRELMPVSAAMAQLAGDLEHARLEILHRLARATEHHDDDTFAHTERVGVLAARVGVALGLPDEQVARLRQAAPLHDIGKIGVPDTILRKPGPLTADERRQMQRHTTIGAEILAGSASPVLQMAEQIALGHHERWDGGGYPLGLAGEAIPLPARIVAIADVYDALTHMRPYKGPWGRERARAEILAQSALQFDPAAVAAFASLELPAVLEDGVPSPQRGMALT